MNEASPTSCQSSEVWIEMLESRSLGPEQVSSLERHLAGCSACRRYQWLVRRMETDLKEELSLLDLEALDARMTTLRARAQRRRGLAFPLLAFFGVTLSVVTGKPVPVLLTVSGVALFILAAFQLRSALEAMRIRKLGRSQAEFLALYREMLRSQQRRLRVAAVLIPIFLLHAVGQWASGHWPHSMRNGASLA